MFAGSPGFCTASNGLHRSDAGQGDAGGAHQNPSGVRTVASHTASAAPPLHDSGHIDACLDNLVHFAKTPLNDWTSAVVEAPSAGGAQEDTVLLLRRVHLAHHPHLLTSA